MGLSLFFSGAYQKSRARGVRMVMVETRSYQTTTDVIAALTTIYQKQTKRQRILLNRRLRWKVAERREEKKRGVEERR
jgi:hypothetical protein